MVADTLPTFNLSGLSKEDAYNKVEFEIQRLKDQIRSLLSIRNSLSPVSSLPNELLSKIFMHSCDFNESGTYSDIRSGCDDGDDWAQPEMRLVVSWVSRHWRSVALGHRPLWNLVVNLQKSLKLDYVRSCGARCQHLLVDLKGPNNSLLDACLSNISQTAHLKIFLPSSAAIPSAISSGHIWAQPAPLFRTLDLDSIRIRSDDAKGASYPKLHSLILSGCNFRWKFVMALSSTISKLDIYQPQRTITIPTCLDLLSSFSLLSECAFYSCLKDNEGSVPARSRRNRACLQQLTKLTLNESTHHIIQLLRALEIPRTSLELFLEETESFDTDAMELFGALQESQGHVWGAVHYLQLQYSFAVANPGSPLRHQLFVSGCNPDLLLLPACKNLDLSALESLWTRFLSAEVLEIASHLTRLQRVVLESSDALEKFVTFLCTEAHDSASTLLFPALQELVLAHVDSEAEEWLEQLYDILASRKIWGFGLPRLVLFQCNAVGIEKVARLKQVVDDVDFCRKSLDFFPVM
ncbi:hypothetical protein BDN72DRAFT_883163 [Pluteus cervinus]|uniref:Uncharacterized protein n=1 Tax=Pluteus cervinus TaxID=181527 RepID=A0ACD3A716_9AGAR|nr:hypothetical protein BDN72DRAFT_883163 [Pluteus cervinus]